MKGLTLTTKEQTRIQVLNAVLEGEVTAVKAAGLMGVSERHGRRLLAAYRKEGAVAIAHGNRGRKPSTTTCPDTQHRVRELAEGRYASFNHTHLTEMLAEREGIALSRSTVRRVLLADGVRSPRRRRASKRYSRRERYPQEGMLLQIDGSRHDWLEGRGPYLTLVGAVDDATGKVSFALFREQEDAHGYLLMLREIIDHHGVPLALYSDRHGIFHRSTNGPRPSLSSSKAGLIPLMSCRSWTSAHHGPHTAGERPIDGAPFRLSPPLTGASTIEQANKVWDFIPRYNERFAVAPAQPGSAYRPLPAGRRSLQVSGSPTTTPSRSAAIQLLSDDATPRQVEVQERLDGSIVVTHHGRTLAAKPAPPEPVTLRARSTRRSNGHLPAETPVADSTGALIHPVGDERRNGARSLQETPPRNPPKTKPRHPSRPAPDHPWR